MSSIDKRTPQAVNYAKLPNPGPFLARIVNNADPMKMGSLEVELLRPVGNHKDAGQQLFTVKYLSPFYGVTGIDHNGTNSGDFNDTQKSYGFWAVPPDVGVIVMVIFVEADPGQGFWMGCVQDTYMNHMIPGIAASHYSQPQSRDQDDTQWKGMASTKELYGSFCLPVGEINRAEFKKSENAPTPNPDVDVNKKPVHPIAKWLYEQGNLHDPVRGVYSSSARRESPSNVYGWSTPGPRDKRQGAKKGKIGRREGKIDTFVSRMGGFCIVMDDGDERFLRKTRPWEGPSDYADIEKGEQGLVDWPRDEAFRIRTRKGAQILLHCSEDLIFITNSRGTAWMEFTSRGAINIHAAEGVHFGTDADISMSAGRDIIQSSQRDIVSNAAATHSVEAGNRISMASDTHIHMAAKQGDIGMAGQSIAVQGDNNLHLSATNIQYNGANHEMSVGQNFHQTISGNYELRAANMFLTADNEFHGMAGTNMLMRGRAVDMSSANTFVVNAGTGGVFQAGEAMQVSGGTMTSIAAENGPVALGAGGSGGTINFTGKKGMLFNTDSFGVKGSTVALQGKEIHLNGSTQVADASVPLAVHNFREPVEANWVGGISPPYSAMGGDTTYIQTAKFANKSLSFPPAPTKTHVSRSVQDSAENQNPEKYNMHVNDRLNPVNASPNSDDPGSYTQDSNQVADPASFGNNNGDSQEECPVNYGGGGVPGDHAGWASLRSGRDAAHELDQSYDGSPTDQYGGSVRVSGAWTKDQEFIQKAGQVAGTIGITRNELLGIIFLESGCNPQAGKVGGHVGLLQFSAASATEVGTSQGALKSMNRVQQMEYVQRYFQKKASQFGKPDGVGAAYMLVALPAWSNRPYTQPLASGNPGDKYYSYWKANPAWRDSQLPGQPITKRGIEAAVKKRVRGVEAALGGGSSGSTGPASSPTTPSSSAASQVGISQTPGPQWPVTAAGTNPR